MNVGCTQKALAMRPAAWPRLGYSKASGEITSVCRGNGSGKAMRAKQQDKLRNGQPGRSSSRARTGKTAGQPSKKCQLRVTDH